MLCTLQLSYIINIHASSSACFLMCLRSHYDEYVWIWSVYGFTGSCCKMTVLQEHFCAFSSAFYFRLEAAASTLSWLSFESFICRSVPSPELQGFAVAFPAVHCLWWFSIDILASSSLFAPLLRALCCCVLQTMPYCGVPAFVTLWAQIGACLAS